MPGRPRLNIVWVAGADQAGHRLQWRHALSLAGIEYGGLILYLAHHDGLPQPLGQRGADLDLPPRGLALAEITVKGQGDTVWHMLVVADDDGYARFHAGGK